MGTSPHAPNARAHGPERPPHDAATSAALSRGRDPLAFDGGWRAGAPVSSSELWATIFSLMASASSAVARFSEVSRYPEGRSPETVERRAQDASGSVWRLAAAILIELDGHVDRDRVLVAAGDLTEEIDDKDDGLIHASEAIASLLHARRLCVEEQVELPNTELQSAAVGILAPLLAQHVCTATRGGAGKPATPS